MSAAVLVALLAGAAPLAGRAHAEHRPEQVRDKLALRAQTQELLDAIAPGDKRPWMRLLAPNFLHMDEEGKVRSKEELLAQLKPLPQGLVGELHIDSFRVQFHKDLAIVAHEDQEQLDYFGQMLHSRFRSLDTWQRTPAGWRLVAEHTAAVLKQPATASVPWRHSCEYAGRYRLTETIVMTISCVPDGLLASREGRPDTVFRMEMRDVFFAPQQLRIRRIFQRSSVGQVVGFVDRREGEDIKWTRVP